MTPRRRRSARELNPRLGEAYDLLRKRGVIYYNDPLKDGRGRSLKPLLPVGTRLHGQLRRLADRTRLTPTVRGRNGPVGGEWRYHFFLPPR